MSTVIAAQEMIVNYLVVTFTLVFLEDRERCVVLLLALMSHRLDLIAGKAQINAWFIYLTTSAELCWFCGKGPWPKDCSVVSQGG